MKIRTFFILLLFLFIHYPVLANPLLFTQTEVKPAVRVSQQVSDIFQPEALLVKLTKLQQKLNKDIAIKIKELKQHQNPLLLFPLLVISFVYGIFHALGPGHGKSIITSWIITQQRSVGTVLFVSLFAAASHALSAGMLVSGTYIVLGKFAAISTQKLNAYLQIAAALLVIGIGLSMLIRLICGSSTKDSSLLKQSSSSPFWESPFAVALSIGIVPCPVTSVILIFCLTLGLFWQGIVLVISFAAGMGVSLVTVAFLVWSLKEKITPNKLSGFYYIITRVLPVAGGIFLVVIGSIMLYSFL